MRRKLSLTPQAGSIFLINTNCTTACTPLIRRAQQGVWDKLCSHYREPC
jgi:hypothetical protein